MEENTVKMAKDFETALMSFSFAIQRNNQRAAVRFREEMHMILDLQLDNVMKETKTGEQK